MKRTALEITSQSFPVVRRGFDPAAVRAFLALLGEEAEAADDHDAALGPDHDARLAAAESARGEAEAARSRAEARVAELERRLPADAAASGATIADAEREAAAIIEAARREADEIHRTRWQEAGMAVSRVLESADLEARRLVEGAEALALQIRDQVEAEVAAHRAESDRATEDALSAVAHARAESERIEIERTVRVEAVVEEAKATAREHIEADLARARDQVEALRAQEAVAIARLQRVRDLVLESLTAAEPISGITQDVDARLLLPLEDREVECGADDPANAPARPEAPEAARRFRLA